MPQQTIFKRVNTLVYSIIGLIFLHGCSDHFSPNNDLDVDVIRTIESETIVNATIEQVWRDWTTKEGQESFFGGQVSIDLKTNGRYDVWFLPDAPAGQRGHEDGRIVAVEPPHLLSFTWTMPPYMPEIRPHHTFVQIHFEELAAGQTKIRLSHSGFGQGTHWDQGYEYFQGVWPEVLKAYATSKH